MMKAIWYLDLRLNWTGDFCERTWASVVYGLATVIEPSVSG